MSLIGIDLENTPPDFINEIGVKWWKIDSITKFAQNEDSKGRSIEVYGYIIEESDETRNYILLNKERDVLYMSQQLDAVYEYIRVLKFLKYNKD